MKMEDIITFVTIVDQKGVLKAADQLFLSQSTVSNRLSSLEEALNTKLIDRSQGQKTLTLTKRGEEFLSYAREYIYLNDTVKEWSTQTPRERLRLGTIDSLSGPLLKYFYSSVIRETNLFLEISHHWTDRIFDLLENHHLDVGIVPRLFHSKNIDTFPIFSEEMVLVSYSQLEQTVHPRDLNPSLEIFFDWGNPFITWHNTWFDTTKRPKMIVDITDPLFEVLKIEGCWAIVPMSVVREYEKRMDFCVARLEESPPDRIGYFAFRPNVQPQKKQAILELKSKLREFIVLQDSIKIHEF